MTFLKIIPRRVKDLLKPLFTPRVPKEVAARFRQIGPEGMARIEASLKRHYFTQDDPWFGDTQAYLRSEAGENDFQNHMHRRLDLFRQTVVPWLDHSRPLRGAKILEIGCGTGSSTVALAEQGAEVTGVDILETSLSVAKDRCAAYGVEAEFVRANATDVHRVFVGRHFDLIIFFATLEHLTHDERMSAMRSTWEMLEPGSFWCVVDTPNRLWYFDHHTSYLPFDHWLPDELAFAHSKFSPRQPYNALYRGSMEGELKLDFLRRGRGVSYHEFDLAMKPAGELDVVSSMPVYLKSNTRLGHALWMLMGGRRFESFLAKAGPDIHRGFYQESLDLIIRKDR